MADTSAVARRYIETMEARDWAAWKALLAEDVVYEVPQTRERVSGRAALLRFNEEYPGDWHLVERLIVGDGEHAMCWLDTRIGDEHSDAIVILGVDGDGAIVAVTDYWPASYEPPPERAHLAERY